MTTTAEPVTSAPGAAALLDSDQQAAVETLHGPLLVVAGPGSGKTRVLTYRLAALVDAGVPPWKLLAVTFTNKAAGEMKDRLASIIGDDYANRAHVSTFHSLCVRILRVNCERIGLPRAFTIFDEDESKKVVAAVAEEAGLLAGLDASEKNQMVKKLRSRISFAKNAALTWEDLAATGDPDDGDAAETMHRYDNHLRLCGGLDFDDLLLYTLQLLRHPETAAEIASRWTHVSVDEFQDTNAVQYEIMSRLVAGHRNVCVVGDADQSIYGFRGARASVLEAFVADYPEAVRVVLNTNYRSASGICEVSRALIEPNVSIARATQAAIHPAGDPVTVTGFGTDRDEAKHVVEAIAKRGPAWSEHAILVRTNALTRSVEQELSTRRIAYEVVGATRFYDRAEIRDAISWMRLIINPRDRAAFSRAVTAPRRGIGDKAVAAVEDRATADNTDMVTAAVRVAEAGGRGAAAIAKFVEDARLVHAAATTQGPSAAVRTVLDHCGLRAALQVRDDKEGTSRVENLDQLLSAAAEFDDNEDGPEEATAAWLESVQLLEASDEADVHDEMSTSDLTGRVSILTIHAAKGREFDHVYLIGVEEEVLPHIRALEAGEEELAEERRLMFVATSRARKTLELSWCESRMKFGQIVSSVKSRFLADLPASVVFVEPPSTFAPRWGSGSTPGRPQWQTQGRSSAGAGYAGRSSSAARGSAFGSGYASASRPSSSSPPASSSVRPVSFGAPARPKVERQSLLLTCGVGDRVEHTKFGAGVITEVDTVADTVTVQFEGVGTKLMSATLAPMTKTS